MKPGDDDLATSTDKLSLTGTNRTHKPQATARTAPRPSPNASTVLRELAEQHTKHQY